MSLNTTPRTFVAGEVETAAIFNAEVRDALTGIQAAWATYVPTYTNLTIGNAAVSARWSRLGKSITLRVDIVGGTTTAATGAVSISLPAAAHATGAQVVTGLYAATATGIGALSISAGASTGAAQYGAPGLTNVTVLGNTHVFRVQGDYEAA